MSDIIRNSGRKFEDSTYQMPLTMNDRLSNILLVFFFLSSLSLAFPPMIDQVSVDTLLVREEKF